jgi:hypothetical protein
MSRHVLLALAAVLAWPSSNQARADAVEPVRWEQRSNALLGVPPARGGKNVVYDSMRHHLVLFGGDRGQNQLLGDTWHWDGQRWHAQQPATAPTPRADHLLVFDEARGRTVLVGGTTKQAPSSPGGWPYLPDREQVVWEWDGATWSKVPAPGGPPSVEHAGATYDVARRLTVVVANFMVYEWDGSTWRSHPAPPLPSPSAPPTYPPFAASGHENLGVTYDRLREKTIVFGTRNGRAETWEWDGATWRNGTPADPSDSPSPRSQFAFVFDRKRGRTVLLGGQPLQAQDPFLNDAWEWDGSTWSKLSWTTPFSPRAGAGVAWDPDAEQILLFGGGGPATSNDLWAWDGTSWRELAPATSPGGYLSHHALAYDEQRSTTVMFGGSAGSTVTGRAAATDATWTWDGTAWTRRLPAVSPPPRHGHALAYDANRGRVVMFGGIDGTHPNAQLLADTWEWDGTTWTRREPSSQPSPRASMAMAYDRERKVVVLFGGAAATATAGDTWEWDGDSWTLHTPFRNPSPRANALMAYDAVTRRVVLFGGGAGGADIWAWDGREWTLRTSAAPVPAGFQGALVGHEVRGTLVLWGRGSGQAQLPGETWELKPDSALNQMLDPAPSYETTMRTTTSMAYDRRRARIVHYGGHGAEDTWEYRATGAACTAEAQCDERICLDGMCRSRADIAAISDAGFVPPADAGLPDLTDAGLDSGTPARDAGIPLDAALIFDATPAAPDDAGRPRRSGDEGGCRLAASDEHGEAPAWLLVVLALASRVRNSRRKVAA